MCLKYLIKTRSTYDSDHTQSNGGRVILESPSKLRLPRKVGTSHAPRERDVEDACQVGRFKLLLQNRPRLHGQIGEIRESICARALPVSVRVRITLREQSLRSGTIQLALQTF